MEKLKKLIRDVNAMDIQNQIGTFGDAFLPTHAGLELKIVEKRIEKLETAIGEAVKWLHHYPDPDNMEEQMVVNATRARGILEKALQESDNERN